MNIDRLCWELCQAAHPVNRNQLLNVQHWAEQLSAFQAAMAPQLWLLADCVKAVEVIGLQGNKNNSTA